MKQDTQFSIATAPKKNSVHWDQGTITWGEIIGWAKEPANRRECGNYVLGRLKGTRRSKGTIQSRGVLTLDLDYATPETAADLELTFPYTALLHTTWKSTPELPRYRLIIPLDREVFPDEYDTAARAVMQMVGEELFDKSSPQPERFMFKPSAQSKKNYHYVVIDGPTAPADDLLDEFQEDLSQIPLPKPHRNKRDPFGLDGTIGAFNRVYEDFDELIKEYELPYEDAGTDRWHLVGARSAAGMGTVAPGLVFSHHSNDPAHGHACSAFDLVRLHHFGHLDEDVKPTTPVNKRPSHKEMLEVASQDAAVVRELVGADFAEELDETERSVTAEVAEKRSDWRLKFRLNSKTGKPNDEIHNWDLIADNDSAFRALFFNDLNMAVEINQDLPWRPLEPGRETFDKADRSRLALHIERRYGIRPPMAYLDHVIWDQAMDRRVNEVEVYLKGLKWDGVPRVEECLPGVRPSPYTRMVARKSLVAAVARMLDPGCKWDHMLVIYGPEGLGKSHWINTLARGFSDSLGQIGNKDTLIAMQRLWIMVADEGHTMKKADFDAQKEFITKTADVFRMPYDREAGLHKRHNVIWGTTNDEVFLRRQEGNRRFLIVHAEEAVDFDVLTDEYVDQLWAEAVHYYRAGERLYLTDYESDMASTAREDFTEEDSLTGQIQEYLDTPVPANWDTYTILERIAWTQTSADELSAKGTKRLDMVCSRQIYYEALGNRFSDPKRMDLLEITNAMRQVPGWTALQSTRRVPGYGPQKVFIRDPEPSDEDLL